MNGPKLVRFERKSLADDASAEFPAFSRAGEDVTARADGYQQCRRCVMDTSDREITFDEQGHCCHCIEFLEVRSKHRYQGAESARELQRIIDEIKRVGQGKPYDSIIGISGGADSG